MNKLLKYFLGVFIIGIGIINTTNATNVSDLLGNGVNILNKTGIVGNPQSQANWNTMYELSDFGVNEGTICFRVNTFETRKTTSVYLYFGFSNAQAIPSNRFQYRQNTTGSRVCAYGNKPEMRFALYQGTNDTYTGYIETEAFLLSDLFNYNISCPTCEEQYTSLQCQTEYNLIPVENVTANYCKLNFDLIAPTECPNIGEGTGAVNWTARYINNQQYPGTASLKLNIADFLERQTTYNQDETIIDVIGYDADEDYIEGIIEKEQLTPTKDDFAYLISNLGDYIPLLAIAGLMIRARRVIKKVF